jgi:hypothetical protein
MTNTSSYEELVPGYDEEDGSTHASRDFDTVLEDFSPYINGGLVVLNDSEEKTGKNFVLLSSRNEARINQLTEQLRGILRALHEMREHA